MKTEKTAKASKVEARSAKAQPAKTGIKMRSGLRAGYVGGWNDKY